ncbi:Rib/alpha-like domain-containing protein [Staphylococcus hyicus]|nr:Rib/alpha-like domain-containing protein [Staphylococcus hyicus]
MSSLTAEGAKAYDTLVNSLPKDQQTAAVRALLQANTQYISATVTGYTNANGDYTLRFPSGTLDLNHVYGFVLDPQGNLVKSYSSFTSPLFRAANANSSFTPQSLPYVRPVRNAWVNVNFAAVGTSNTFINIKNFDVTNNPAKPGDIAYVDITTAALSPLPTYIEWRDSKGNVIQRSGQVTTEQQAEAAGTFTIPSNASSGEVYTVYVVSGGNDVAADSLIVQVTQNAANYQPSYTSTTVSQGETLVIHTPLNTDGTSLPTGTTFKGGNNIPTWATVNTDGSITVAPDATVDPGSYNVPVVVTYPDGSRETVYAPVMVKVPDATVYNPTATPVNNAYGSGTTVAQVTSSVSIPGYPTTGPQPVITVNDPSQLPNGTTPGTVNVPVTVTYPDGSTDQITVPVITGDAQATQYDPTANPVNNPYGSATTANQVIENITVPGYPTTGPQPTYTIVKGTILPDGTTPGTVNVPVTVTYPDGSTDQIFVPVTTGQPQATTYDPVGVQVNNSFGTSTTENQVVNAVIIPGYTTTGPQPVITVNDPSTLPNGQTAGTVNVSMTVTYPDGSTDQVTVPVTTGNTQATQYQPAATAVTNAFGTQTTENQVLSHVTVPHFPTTGPQPTFTLVEGAILPDGTQTGTFDVPVIVTYPDGSKDTISVPVIVGEAQAVTYIPTVTTVDTPYGTATTENDIVKHVSVPNYPTTGAQPQITVDNVTALPDGKTPGTFNVPVTVTYPDGSVDHTTVKVNVGQPQATQYDPTATSIFNPYGTATTENQVVGNVSVPGFPSNGVQPSFTLTEGAILPNGTQTGSFNVPVVVTYPDGSKDIINVPVTVGEPQAVTYEPIAKAITNPYGTATTSNQILANVSVPGFPTNGAQPSYTLADNAILPNGSQSGTFSVPVVVTYPDGTKDTINVPVTIGEAQAIQYEPVSTPIDKPYGTATSEIDILSHISIPGYPTTGQQPTISIDDVTTLPDGMSPGSYNIPVTVTYPDGSIDHISVAVTVGQTQATSYQPIVSPINKTYGNPTTVDDVIQHISIPGYPETGKPVIITVDQVSALPDGLTAGQFDIPTTIVYPDGSTEKVIVPVTVAPSQATTNHPVGGIVNNPFGTPTTEAQVIDQVTVPGYSATGPQPVVTVNHPVSLPDGTVTGTVEIPVTVTYPDGSSEQIYVTVTTGNTQATQFDPVTSTIEKPYGSPTNREDILQHITVPGYPVNGDQPVVTILEPNLLPTGYVSGSFEVPVLVTYPDGSSDTVKVPVIVSTQPQNSQYEPVTSQVNKPFGTATTESDVIAHITIPGYPSTGTQPVITVDNPSSLPNGTTSGSYDVSVTVTYPDGTTDHITVPVVVGAQPQNTAFEPKTTPVEKPFGTPTMTDDITGSVTIPGYLPTGAQPIITVDNPTSLPNGTTPGTVEVPVTVTYPDGSVDKITVSVTTSESQATTNEPKTTPVDKPFGTPTTVDDITGSVTIPGYLPTGAQPIITVDNPTSLPNGTTPGTVEVPVTVTYPDGSVDKITVSVTTSESQATINEPKTTPVDKPYGSPTTVEDITGSVTIPGYPPTGAQPVITVDNPSTLPDGTTPGTVGVPVTVTYPDGSQDHTTVPVTVEEPQANTYEPKTTPVEKPNGTPTTVDDITGSVTVPNFPPTGEQPVIKVDNPSTLPDGTTPGTVEVPVTVTYPDGSKDHTTVPVTTGISQAEQNNPGYHDGVAKPGETIHIPQNGDQNMPNGTKYGVTPSVPSGWEIKIDEVTGELIVTPPNNAKPGTSIVTEVIVHYPDGSTEVVQVIITVGETSEKPLPSPTPHIPSTPHTGTITGEQSTPGHSICVTWPNGTVTIVPVKKDGTWTVDVPKQVEKDLNVINFVEVNHKGHVSKVNTVQNRGRDSKVSQHELPNTGEHSDTKTFIFGSLFAALGSLILFRRQRKEKNLK